ncbi:MAG TPA: hypothetical protein VMR16_00495 [Candidatus Saccharimonadales bacterium]|nr:hypothetical protein [Candidatus Saccharimonadales bacterium]
MKKYTVYAITTIGLAILAVSLFTSGSIVAAQSASTPGTGSALEIAPPVLILKANPGQTVTAQINLRDISKVQQVVTSQVDDFGASGEEGLPQIDVNNSTPGPYSIINWVSPPAELTLNSKQIKSLPLTINVPANASPGGYYGVIRFTATAPELSGTGVALTPSLGALVFIRVNGNAKESLSVASFTAINPDDTKSGWLFEKTPIQFDVRIQNTGNVFEQPAGVISITDMFGKKIADVNVNQPPGYVLPHSIRKYSQVLNGGQLGNKWLFGKYTAKLELTYGAKNQTLTQTMTFWVIPWRLILVVVVVLIGVIIALYYGIKRYNQFVVKRAQGHRTKRK